MSTATLTSLAILKVNIDQGRDYLDYLRPFVMQVLFEKQPDYITDDATAAAIQDRFGLVIPSRTVQIVLRRLTRSGHLRRENKVYVLSDVSDPGMASAQEAASRHIDDTLDGLIDFAHQQLRLSITKDRAIEAICLYLSSFDVSCLGAYLRGTAIPEISGGRDHDVTLVSKYLMELCQSNNDALEKFMLVVQGHMLANALLCPDLKSAKNFRRTTFYMDTPLLVQLLGLEGASRKTAVEELVRLLTQLGGKIAVFSHTREELGRVLDGSAARINAMDGRGRIVEEARRSGLTRSDLLLLAGKVDELLGEYNVDIRTTPGYTEVRYQIDESRFEGILDDGVSYYNPRAKEYDVNSVRSVYVLRRGSTPRAIEDAKAILVTSNTAFARAAWDYGRGFEASREVSSVISDFSLANVAWLKAPMGAPSLPMAEVLAFSYAAVQPSSALMGRFLGEIDRLRKSGEISERDHQLLRSSPRVYDELVSMTLGDDAALTGSGVREVLDRVVSEITQEADEELAAERAARQEVERKLREITDARRRREEGLYWRCERIAGRLAYVPVMVAFLPAAMVVVSQAGYWMDVAFGRTIYAVGWLSLAGWTLGSLICGATLVGVHGKVKKAIARVLRRWFLSDAQIKTGT